MKHVVRDEFKYYPRVREIIALLDRIEYTQRDMTAFIERWDYGWDRQMPMLDEEYTSYSVRFGASVKDICDPGGRSIELYGSGVAIRPDMKADQIVHFFYRAIREFELHEMAEHFFFDGVKVMDPHKDDKPLAKAAQK